MVLLEVCSSMVLVSLVVSWCLILSSVISPTGGMVMCVSSSQVSILHLKKDVLILFSFGCFFDRVLRCFCQTFDSFLQHVVSLWFESFPWLLTDLLFSLFWGADISFFWWVLLFQNCAVIHKVAQCVIPMQIRYILIYFIHRIRTGPLHMFKLFSSWICMSRQLHKVTSGQIIVTVSSHQFETQGTKTQAKSWLTVIHKTQSIANIPAKTVNN